MLHHLKLNNWSRIGPTVVTDDDDGLPIKKLKWFKFKTRLSYSYKEGAIRYLFWFNLELDTHDHTPETISAIRELHASLTRRVHQECANNSLLTTSKRNPGLSMIDIDKYLDNFFEPFVEAVDAVLKKEAGILEPEPLPPEPVVDTAAVEAALDRAVDRVRRNPRLQ